jgi:hypothetical protein
LPIFTTVAAMSTVGMLMTHCLLLPDHLEAVVRAGNDAADQRRRWNSITVCQPMVMMLVAPFQAD